MRTKTVLVALMLVLAAGPALAMGTAAASPTATATEQPADYVTDEHLDCEFPVEVEDATGETVTIEEEPNEVVVLYPNVAQHLWEIGAEEKVIGMPVNENTEYLNGSENRTHILTEGSQGFDIPNNELIVDLEADLVLAPNVTPASAIEELRDSGQTVYRYAGSNDLDSMLSQVEQTGQLVGECDAATELTANLSDRIDAVEASTADSEGPTVFWDLGDEPSGPFTVNNGSLEHDVITTAGGENIASDIPAEFGGGYPQISTEVILDENPDVIVVPDGRLSEFTGYEELSAFENDNVITVEGNHISQHGPRNVDVLERLAAEFETGETDQQMDGTENASQPDDSDQQDSADDSGPGLTVGAAIAALVALAVVAGRRE